MEFDFNDLESIVDAAGNMGTATGKLANGVAAVKGLLKGSKAGADPKVELALSELTGQIAQAQFANAELKLQLSVLQGQLAELNALKADLSCYELWKTPSGSLVYRPKHDEKQSEPEHYLCPNCLQKKVKSILQGHAGWRECSSCKAGFSFDKSPPRDPIVKVRRHSDIF